MIVGESELLPQFAIAYRDRNSNSNIVMVVSRITLWWLGEPQPPRARFRLRWLRFSKPQFSFAFENHVMSPSPFDRFSVTPLVTIRTSGEDNVQVTVAEVLEATLHYDFGSAQSPIENGD